MLSSHAHIPITGPSPGILARTLFDRRDEIAAAIKKVLKDENPADKSSLGGRLTYIREANKAATDAAQKLETDPPTIALLMDPNDLFRSGMRTAFANIDIFDLAHLTGTALASTRVEVRAKILELGSAILLELPIAVLLSTPNLLFQLDVCDAIMQAIASKLAVSLTDYAWVMSLFSMSATMSGMLALDAQQTFRKALTELNLDSTALSEPVQFLAIALKKLGQLHDATEQTLAGRDIGLLGLLDDIKKYAPSSSLITIMLVSAGPAAVVANWGGGRTVWTDGWKSPLAAAFQSHHIVAEATRGQRVAAAAKAAKLSAAPTAVVPVAPVAVAAPPTALAAY
jgi:hypothetical protein